MSNINNMNIPNLFGEHSFNNESVFQKMAEQQYKSKLKKVKFIALSGVLSLCFSVGSFVYQNSVNQEQKIFNDIATDFIIKNQNSFPISKNALPEIQKISEINKKLLQTHKINDIINNEIQNINKISNNDQLSDNDRLKLFYLNSFGELVSNDLIKKETVNNLLKLGIPENQEMSKLFQFIHSNQKLLIENEAIKKERLELINMLINQLKTTSESNVYYILSLLAFIYALSSLAISIWLFINTEKEKLNNEQLNLMQENLNIASLSNTLMDFDINNIAKIPENDGITGSLISAINNIFGQFSDYMKKNQSIVNDLQSIKKQISLTTFDTTFSLNKHNMKLKSIINNFDLNSTNFDNQKKSILVTQLNAIEKIELSKIDYKEIEEVVLEINELDQDLSVMLQNLELFFQNSSMEQLNNHLALGIIQEKLPNLIKRKMELNQKLNHVVNIQRDKLKTNQKEIMTLGKQIPMIRESINDLFILENQENIKNNLIDELQEIIGEIEKDFDMLNFEYKNQKRLIEMFTTI